MRLQCCKHNYQALMIGLVLFLSVGIASATVGVSGTVYGETAQGKYLYAPYIQVKFCTNSNGGGYCGSTTADSLGNYSVTLSAAGNYWMFAWDDTHYWGSSTQSTFCCAVQIGSWWSYVYAVSFPRPSLPQAFYPQNNQMNVPWNTG